MCHTCMEDAQRAHVTHAMGYVQGKAVDNLHVVRIAPAGSKQVLATSALPVREGSSLMDRPSLAAYTQGTGTRLLVPYQTSYKAKQICTYVCVHTCRYARAHARTCQSRPSSC